MATYNEIQEYIKAEHGFTVKTCWIEDMKEICGLPRRDGHNRNSPDLRLHPCPESKKEVILEAFKHFKMIE